MPRPGARAAAMTMVLAALFAGCKSPSGYHKEADRVAANIIAAKQKQALGHTEPFTIERPEDTFRKRLIDSQGLPIAGPESLGTSHLPQPSDWPEKTATPKKAAGEAQGAGEAKEKAPAEPVKLSLFDALQVAAANSREYQSQKEALFRTALDLDLRRNDFRSIFSDSADATFETDHSQGKPENSVVASNSVSWSKLLKNGASITAGLALDLAKLLTGGRASSLGIAADGSISVPLLRGAGTRVVTEPLTQAERNVVYAIYTFEDYRRDFAVRVASQYLDVLRSLDSVKNAEDNYKSLITSARRARRLADAGRLPEIQVDQARQDELRARDRWITAMASHQNSLDNFKLTLGLPTDAEVALDPEELDRLAASAKATVGEDESKTLAPDAPPAAEPAAPAPAPQAPGAPDASQAPSAPSSPEAQASVPAANAPVELKGPSREGAGPYEIDERLAIDLALENRLDLRTAVGNLYDAQRQVIVAANALEANLDIRASGSFGQRRSAGSAGSPNAELRPERGTYDLTAAADLPWQRTSERNNYRKSLIDFEKAARDLQQTEDQVKQDIRNDLRTLLTSRESIKIQLVAVNVARRRVNSVELFLQAGRAEIRDLLDAQEALVSAQNALTAGLVDYRVAALALQRDMGLLETDEKGLWREYDPAKFKQSR